MSILSIERKFNVLLRQIMLRLVVTLAGTLFATQFALADAPLKSKLDLDVEQAGIVSQIQKRYRAEKRSIRQVLNRTSRKLRRAKTANDSKAIATLTQEVASMELAMRTAILDEDNEIRKVLNTEQLLKFEDYIVVRSQMKGSSRDVNVQ